jgi:nucleoside-diphosphate-sugar epimerase
MNAYRSIVLVISSNGCIGSAVMRRLTGRFSDVIGFDRKAPSPPARQTVWSSPVFADRW